jgi:hypothetical protein
MKKQQKLSQKPDSHKKRRRRRAPQTWSRPTDRLAKMPWGQYKGYYLKDVPTDYLKWCVLNYQDQGMAQWLADELQRRPAFRSELRP